MRPRFSCYIAALLALAALGLGCEGPIDAGGQPARQGAEDDPLALPDTAAPGSLDFLHTKVIQRSCAGQPGLCHHGQFEPNLSTPALTYANLVLRPSLEKDKRARVVPGDPAASFLIDKLRNRDVISQMPLGAEPLAEEDLVAIEAWIQGGALRRPGDPPAPVLNNPPAKPEIAIFDASGARLDGAGQVVVHPGDTLTLRMSVQDFETDDADIDFAGFELVTPDDLLLLLVPELGADGHVVYGEYDEVAPEGLGDKLNYRVDITLGETSVLLGDEGETTEVPSAGLTLSPVFFYADQPLEQGGMIAWSFQDDLLKVTP
jgi:hypothetical protein